VVICIYLNGLCAAGVNRFNDIFTSFYAHQWYDVTRASLTVEDRLLIKALHIEKGWRCGSNDCGIYCQTVVIMSTSTNKHRYKNKLLGLLLTLHGGNVAQNQQFYHQNSPISYLHRQFNDRYITSFIINVYFRRCIFKVELPFKSNALVPCETDLSK